MKVQKISAKQMKFVEEYLLDWNASAAALRAGYSDGSHGRHTLTKPHVVEYLEMRTGECLKALRVNQLNVLQEIARLAFSNVADCFDEDGNIIPIKELPRDVSAAISSIEVSTTWSAGDDPIPTKVTKIRLWDKSKAQEKLGKHLQLFVDKLEIETNQPINVIIRKFSEPPKKEE